MNIKIKNEDKSFSEKNVFPSPSKTVLDEYPALRKSLEGNDPNSWTDSDGWGDRDTWGDTGWSETV